MIGILWNVLILVGSSMSKIGIFLLSQSGYTVAVPIQGGECHHVTTAIFFCVAETQKEKSFHISSSGITQCDTFRHSISSSVLETQPCLFLENSRPGFFSHFLTHGKFGLHLLGWFVHIQPYFLGPYHCLSCPTFLQPSVSLYA